MDDFGLCLVLEKLKRPEIVCNSNFKAQKCENTFRYILDFRRRSKASVLKHVLNVLKLSSSCSQGVLNDLSFYLNNLKKAEKKVEDGLMDTLKTAFLDYAQRLFSVLNLFVNMRVVKSLYILFEYVVSQFL